MNETISSSVSSQIFAGQQKQTLFERSITPPLKLLRQMKIFKNENKIAGKRINSHLYSDMK